MENNNPKVSVIVPVYKAEVYLHRCVDSLLSQTFQDYEILLVDDGSPDRSGEICDEYAKKDSRVRVFHKENGGVSSARQCGIDNARGEYTIHADPDDWVEPEMLEELYKKAKEDDADMVICDFYEERKDSTKYIKQEPSSLNHEVVLRELFQQLHGSCWNKLVRRVCYKEYGVSFPKELNYCEDLFVNTSLLSHNINIVYLSKAYYHYDLYSNSESLVKRPLKIILMQEQILYAILKSRISPRSFEQISPFLLSRLAYKELRIGNPYLKTFKKEFVALRPYVALLNVSFHNKIMLWSALYITPYLVYMIYLLKLRIQNSLK